MVKALSLILFIIYAASCFKAIDLNEPIANLDAALSNIR
jgi:hypothetical protein